MLQNNNHQPDPEQPQDINTRQSDYWLKMGSDLESDVNTLLGYTQILLQEATEQGLTQITPRIEQIYRYTQRIYNEIENRSRLSLLQLGEAELNTETFDLSKRIKEALRRYKREIAVNNTLELNLAENLGAVESDPIKFYRVVFELLRLTWKFAYGERAVLEANRETVQGVDWITLNIMIRVNERITETELEHLFKSFEKGNLYNVYSYAEAYPYEPELVICKEYCRLMGGSLALEKLGTTDFRFSIRLPVRGRPSTEN